MYRLSKLCIVLILPTLLSCSRPAADAGIPSDEEVRTAIVQAVAYFRTIAANGGYLWWYSEDLSERAGEEIASPTTIWLQPPGTPAVGMAYLRAWEATGDARCLDAALAAAGALVEGQLESGGWDNKVDFNPDSVHLWYHRSDIGTLPEAEIARRRNRTTFDDDKTQSGLRLLLAAADAGAGQPGGRTAAIREARDYGLDKFLLAQYPNGAWPHAWEGVTPAVEQYPVLPARFPADYPRKHPQERHGIFYTFNDDGIRDCILTVLDAWRRTGDTRFLESAKRGGEFIILAQLPEPQPAWAQQYNLAMEPAWARRFEPTSVCSRESAGAIRTLVDLYLETGDEKYLAPVPAAEAWFERSQISPDRWARFYEIHTNRPLYFTRQYELVYTDHDMPTHYSFQGGYGIREALGYYQDVRQLGREGYRQREEARLSTAEQKAARRAELVPRVEEIIAALDEQRRWLSEGRIECRTFIRNLETLCEYLEMGK